MDKPLSEKPRTDRELRDLLELRLKHYQRERFRFWTREFPGYAAACFGIACLMTWGLQQAGPSLLHALALEETWPLYDRFHWLDLALILTIPALLPLIFVLGPKKPSLEALRQEDTMRQVLVRMVNQESRGNHDSTP